MNTDFTVTLSFEDTMKRNNVCFITVNGDKKSIWAWSKELNMSYYTMKQVLLDRKINPTDYMRWCISTKEERMNNPKKQYKFYQSGFKGARYVLTYEHRTRSMSQWARHYGISYGVIYRELIYNKRNIQEYFDTLEQKLPQVAVPVDKLHATQFVIPQKHVVSIYNIANRRNNDVESILEEAINQYVMSQQVAD